MVKIDWHPDGKSLRKFGLVVIIGLTAIGLALQFGFDRPQAGYGCYVAAGLLGVPALTGTVIGLPGYWLWMGIAFVMGNVLNRILLTIIYYTLFLLIGGTRRLLGNDKLALRRRSSKTYWQDLEPSPTLAERYERQF